MDNVLLAYLAGAIDSDGSIGIKRSTYHRRVRGDASNPTYSERVMLKQVTPQIPTLLKECFGGTYRLENASTRDGKPLYSFQVTDKQAAEACRLLLPYLRVKHRQAEIVLELRESKDSRYQRVSYWFVKEHPDWQDMELITTSEASAILGYGTLSVLQAARNGTIIGLPGSNGGHERPRFPRLLVERLAQNTGQGGGQCRPAELIQWRERLCEEMRELNKNGVVGTSLYRREGPHKPMD